MNAMKSVPNKKNCHGKQFLVVGVEETPRGQIRIGEGEVLLFSVNGGHGPCH